LEKAAERVKRRWLLLEFKKFQSQIQKLKEEEKMEQLAQDCKGKLNEIKKKWIFLQLKRTL